MMWNFLFSGVASLCMARSSILGKGQYIYFSYLVAKTDHVEY